MDKSKVAEHDGKARRAFNVKAEMRQINPAYSFQDLDGTEITETGYLIMFRIVPQGAKTKEPEFVGRWDEKANTLDIDVVNCSREERMAFRGHHPSKTAREGRFFDVNIIWKDTQIYKGVVGFSLQRSVVLQEGIVMGDKVEAQVVRICKSCDK